MGSTETKYFPVHVDYNIMIKTTEFKQTHAWHKKENEGNTSVCSETS